MTARFLPENIVLANVRFLQTKKNKSLVIHNSRVHVSPLFISLNALEFERLCRSRIPPGKPEFEVFLLKTKPDKWTETVNSRPGRSKTLMSCALSWALMCAGYAVQDPILVVSPARPEFKIALKGMVEELEGEMRVHEYFITKETSVQDLRRQMTATRPRLVVLMNNSSVHLYRRFQQQLPSEEALTPCLILMAVYAAKEVSALRNATAIQYEVQGITSLVHLRSLLKDPVERVGVVYRSNFQDFFEEQKNTCRMEQIDLIGQEIPPNAKNLARALKRSLYKLCFEDRVDAIWVLNDNAIINRKLLKKAWLPVLKRFPKPVVVSVEALVSGRMSMGQFAVVPDHFSMGAQAAELVFEIRDRGWRIGPDTLHYPISVKKILNLNNLPPGVQLDQEALLELDRVIR